MNKQHKTLQAVLGLFLCLLLAVSPVAPMAYGLAEDAAPVDTPISDPAPAADPAPTDITDPAPVDTPADVQTETPAPTDAPTEAPTPEPTDSLPVDVPTEEPTEDPGVWTRTNTSPMDVRDIMSEMGFSPESLIDRFTVSFTENGQPVTEPTENSQIELTLHLHLPEGVSQQIRRDDWYVITAPHDIVPTGMHVIDLVVGDITYAKVEVETGPLRVKFTSDVSRLDSISDNFTITANFVPGVYAPGQSVTFSLPGVDAAPATFTMAQAQPDAPDEPTGKPIDEPTEPVELDPDALVNEILDAGDDVQAMQDGNADDMNAQAVDAAGQTISGQSVVTGLTLSYTQDGEPTDTPTTASQVQAGLSLQAPEAVMQQLLDGATYMITMPQALKTTPGQTVALSDDAGIWANATTGDNNTVLLTLADGVTAADARSATATFDAAFNTDVVTEAGAYVISLPNETLAPAVDVTVTAAPAQEGGDPEAWTRPDDGTPMNVKDIMRLLGMSQTSILTNISLTYEDPDTGESSTTEAPIDAAINFQIGLHIPQELADNLREGDTYIVNLPPEIKVEETGDTAYELYGPDGVTSYGTATVQTNGQVVIKFHSNITELGEADGEFHFSASFNKDQINTPGDHEITIPDEPGDLSVSVNIVSKQQQAVDKQGTPDKTYNPTHITWNVDFNKPLSSLSNAVLSDAIPEGLSIENVEVFAIGVDLDGNVIPNSETALTTGYTVDPDGTVHFASPLTNAVRVRYTTRIDSVTDDGGDLRFVNTATLTSDDTDPISTTATVTAHYGRSLEKVNTSYDPATQSFGWEIRYNYGEQTLSAGDATLTDTLTNPQNNMVYDPETVEVRAVTINDKGQATVGGLLGPGQYSISFPNNQMVITFPNGLSQAVNVRYKTHITGIVDDSGVQYSNDASTTWGDRSHVTTATKPTVQQNIIKSVLNVQDENRQIMWMLHINVSHYTMHSWQVTDTFGPGQRMMGVNDNFQINDFFSIYDVTNGVTLQYGTDYTITATENGFISAFTDAYLGEDGTSSEYELVYSTIYDEDAPQNITNSATDKPVDGRGRQRPSQHLHGGIPAHPGGCGQRQKVRHVQRDHKGNHLVHPGQLPSAEFQARNAS